MNIRPAIREDFVRFYGAVPVTARAFVAEEDGNLIAIAGLYNCDIGQVFFGDIDDTFRKRFPLALVRTAKKIMSLAKGTVVTIADEHVEAADRFLRYLGFDRQEDGVYLWQR